MPSIHSLVSKLATTHTDILFKSSEEFRWSPEDRTIFYQENNELPLLLHELAHALLGHTDYKRDTELIELERDAWIYTQNELAKQYGVEVYEADIQDALDTYREWLHARSTCPNCSSTGVQVKRNAYRCLACQASWRVNDAKVCALRRYLQPN